MQAGSKAAGHGDQGGGMQLMTGTRLLLYIPVRPATGSSMRACASLARASQPLSHLPSPTPGSAPPQMGETPLIRCAHNGHFQTVKFLVEQGADVNAVDMVRRDREGGGWCLCESPDAIRCSVAPCGGWVAGKTACARALAGSPLPACGPDCLQGDNCALHWAAMRGHGERGLGAAVHQ